MPYKDFADDEILYASDVDTFLMRQAVMTFTTAEARTAALSTAVTEGMASYITSQNSMEIYNGSAWVSANSLGGTVSGVNIVGDISTATISGANVTGDISTATISEKNVNTFMNNLSTSTGRNIVASDENTFIRCAVTSGTPIFTFTSSTGFSVGGNLHITCTEPIRIAAGAGVSQLGGKGTTSATFELQKFGLARITKVADTDVYYVFGDVTAV
jgi:hypothetical protein